MTNLFDYIDSILDDVKTRYVVIALLSCPIIEILNFEPKRTKKEKEMSFEKPVGETFSWKDKTLVVKKAERCEDCFFFNYMDCSEFIFVTGPCTKRKDGNNVKFVEVKFLEPKKKNDGK